MLNRTILIFALLLVAAVGTSAQNFLSGTRLRLVEPLPTQVYGGILVPPTPPSADVIFNFPPTGGYLLVASGPGQTAWLVGGNTLTGTGLLGSANAQDVSFVAGGVGNVRMRLEDDAKAVSLPDQTALRLMEPTVDGSNYSAMSAQAQSGNITYTLPNSIGAPGQVLGIAVSPAPTPTTASLTWITPSVVEPGIAFFGYIPEDEQTPASCDVRWSFSAPTVGTYMFKAHIRWYKTSGGANNPQLCWNLPSGATIAYEWHSIEPTACADNGTSTTAAATTISLSSPTGTGEEFSITGEIVVTTPGTIDLRIGKTGGSWQNGKGSYMVVVQP